MEKRGNFHRRWGKKIIFEKKWGWEISYFGQIYTHAEKIREQSPEPTLAAKFKSKLAFVGKVTNHRSLWEFLRVPQFHPRRPLPTPSFYIYLTI